MGSWDRYGGGAYTEVVWGTEVPQWVQGEARWGVWGAKPPKSWSNFVISVSNCVRKCDANLTKLCYGYAKILKGCNNLLIKVLEIKIPPTGVPSTMSHKFSAFVGNDKQKRKCRQLCQEVFFNFLSPELHKQKRSSDTFQSHTSPKEILNTPRNIYLEITLLNTEFKIQVDGSIWKTPR